MALVGLNNLKNWMSDFYKQRRQRPVTTMSIEEFLICRSGNAQLVDAFHRFVYGFGNPSPTPDFKQFAGTQFSYPNDFLPCTAAASGFELAEGASAIVKTRWPKALVPSAGTHACLLAAVLTRSDHPVAGRHVWEHNNLAQKNLTIVDLLPNTWLVLPFVAANLLPVSRAFRLELLRPQNGIKIEAALLHSSREVFRPVPDILPNPFDLRPAVGNADDSSHLDCAAQPPSSARDGVADTTGLPVTSDTEELLAHLFPQGFEVPFPRGLAAQIPLTIRPQEQFRIKH